MLSDPRVLNGYRAYLNEDDFGYIGFHKWALVLFHTNQRSSKCKQCEHIIDAGEGVYHHQHGNKGYVHLECAKQLILKYGNERGFTVSPLLNLQACAFAAGRFTAQEVASSIRVSDRERVM